MLSVTTPSTPTSVSRDVIVRNNWRCFRLSLLASVWITAVAVGFFLLLDYKQVAGEASTPPATWPEQSSLPTPAGRPTLLVFSHPHCPCTRATFRELEQILAQVHFRIDVRVIFVGVSDEPAASEKISILSSAQLPLAEIYCDEGELARQFRVKTSGHVLFYNAHGELRFSGGVTASRGHEGDSCGGIALTSWIRTGAGDLETAPVFGCPLFVSPQTQGAKCDLTSCEVAVTGE